MGSTFVKSPATVAKPLAWTPQDASTVQAQREEYTEREVKTINNGRRIVIIHISEEATPLCHVFLVTCCHEKSACHQPPGVTRRYGIIIYLTHNGGC